MREILFRGKRKDNGEWVYGEFFHPCNICWDEIGYEELTSQDDVLIGNDAQVCCETVGQYTGLKDKNGNKIFEGDIVLMDNRRTRFIQYSALFAAFVVCRYYGKDTSEIFESIGLGYDSYKHSIEVIGNIHDNKEVLENCQ